MTEELTAAHLRELGNLIAGVSAEERERMYVKAADYVRRHSAYVVPADVEKVVNMFREVYPNRPVPDLVSSGGGRSSKQPASPYVSYIVPAVAVIASTAAVVIIVAYLVSAARANRQRAAIDAIKTYVDQYVKSNDADTDEKIKEIKDLEGKLRQLDKRLPKISSNADALSQLDQCMDKATQEVSTAVRLIQDIIDRVETLSKIEETFDELDDANRMIVRDDLNKLALPSSAKQLDRAIKAAEELYHGLDWVDINALNILKHVPDDEAYRLQKSQVKTRIVQMFAGFNGLIKVQSIYDGTYASDVACRIIYFYEGRLGREIRQIVSQYTQSLAGLESTALERLEVLNKVIDTLGQGMKGINCITLLSELEKAVGGSDAISETIKSHFDSMRDHIQAVADLLDKSKGDDLGFAKIPINNANFGDPKNLNASRCVDNLCNTLIGLRTEARRILGKIKVDDAPKGCVELINKHLGDLDKVIDNLTKYTRKYSTDISGPIENISRILK